MIITESDILTIRQALAQVAGCKAAYDLIGKFDEEFGELTNQEIFYFKIGRDGIGKRAVVPRGRKF